MGQTYIVAWNPSISAQFLNKNRYLDLIGRTSPCKSGYG